MKSEHRFTDPEGRVRQWPRERADQRLVLGYLATKFDLGVSYREPEVNERLTKWHTFNDWSLLRRELFEQGFLNRSRDGSDYHLAQITTALPQLLLVQPNIERDPPLAVRWLKGAEGRKTLRLMANPDRSNKPTSLEDERQRVRDFITQSTHRTWMLNFQGHTVGAVWLDLEPTDYLSAPSVHIMIGDPSARRRGLGEAAIRAVIALLQSEGQKLLYSRHLTSNVGSSRLLGKIGFTPDGPVYRDEDGLEFQNVKLSVSGPSADGLPTQAPASA